MFNTTIYFSNNIQYKMKTSFYSYLYVINITFRKLLILLDHEHPIVCLILIKRGISVHLSRLTYNVRYVIHPLRILLNYKKND